MTSLARRARARYAGIEIRDAHAVTRSAGGCARVAEALAAVLAELRET